MPGVSHKRQPGRLNRAFVVTAFATITITTVGCGINPFRNDGPANPEATATTPAAVVYQRPADPCAAAPPELAKRLGMTDATPRSTTQFATDSATPQDPLVIYDLVTCEWVVANPAKGPRGRPNQMTMRVAYAVIQPERESAPAVAQTVYAQAYDGMRQHKDITVVREGKPTISADDGYYVYATRRSTTGTNGEVETAIRVANAVVTVQFSGADLTLDPTLPRGLQLVTKAVAEPRLQLAVADLLPEALAILK